MEPPTTLPMEERKKYVFRPGMLDLGRTGAGRKDQDNGWMPSITLYESETGIPVAHPGFERWYVRSDDGAFRKGATLRKRASNICAFLNYVLWNTDHARINEVTVDDLAGFVSWFRSKRDGTPRDPSEWQGGIGDAFRFLSEYRRCNLGAMAFLFDAEDLFKDAFMLYRGRNYIPIVKKCNTFQVKPPEKGQVRYRFLPEGYLGLLLFEADKYDPMISLAIALQAYAGLREGEVVNISRGCLSVMHGGFGTVAGIRIDLRKEAPFNDGRLGDIKVPREQDVYHDFVADSYSRLKAHEELLFSLGAPQDDDAPLFLNSHGAPLSAATYRERYRKLFTSHFVPSLKKLSAIEGTWADNAPFIEEYERAFPGCHLGRHYFTMYLLSHARLSREEIAKWRGDSNVDSMDEYVHANGEMAALYSKASLSFQRGLFEKVLGCTH